MLDLRYLRAHTERVRRSYEDRGETVDLNAIIKRDEERRRLITEVDELKAKKKRPPPE